MADDKAQKQDDDAADAPQPRPKAGKTVAHPHTDTTERDTHREAWRGESADA